MAAQSQSMSESTSESTSKRRFRWNDDKVNNLIQCLANYKSHMEFNSSDYNADKVKQYEAVRVLLAEIYADVPSLFGPPCLVSSPLLSKSDDSLDEREKQLKVMLQKQRKDEKELVKKGYQRVQEKLKEIRQNFSVAVTSGRRSGSGKVVMDFYDQLVQIWGGSPSTEPLSCGTCTDEVNSLDKEQSVLSSDDKDDSDDLTGIGDNENISRKRKVVNPTPKLIDNKRKHMERQLSSAQRDQLLMNEAKEDSKFKRDMAEAMRQSNETFATSMQQMSTSIVQVAQSLSQSVELMSRALFSNDQNNQHVLPYHRHSVQDQNSRTIYNNYGTSQLHYSVSGGPSPDGIGDNPSGNDLTYHQL